MDMPVIPAGPIAVLPQGAPMPGGEGAFTALLDALLPIGGPPAPGGVPHADRPSHAPIEAAGEPPAFPMPDGMATTAAPAASIPARPAASIMEEMPADRPVEAAEPGVTDTLLTQTRALADPASLPSIAAVLPWRPVPPPPQVPADADAARAGTAAAADSPATAPREIASLVPSAVEPAATRSPAIAAQGAEDGTATPAQAPPSSQAAASTADQPHPDPTPGGASPSLGSAAIPRTVAGFAPAASRAASLAPAPTPIANRPAQALIRRALVSTPVSCLSRMPSFP
ncbi:hypothetical protein [Falsiroseomonas oryziterrae]|uniref:hypothetical protein n=1 Tax=Falsiroseomonas oryziterrae TaxID=2911368 RepID=UPI001F3C519A|nr:hypothetical protein [Roseomonas sp. NPKOSM-4]